MNTPTNETNPKLDWAKKMRSVIQQNERDARNVVIRHGHLATMLEDLLKEFLGDNGYQLIFVERGSGGLPRTQENSENKIMWEAASQIPHDAVRPEHRVIAAFRVANPNLPGNGTVLGLVMATRTKETITVVLDACPDNFELTKDGFQADAEKLLTAIVRRIWFEKLTDGEYEAFKAIVDRSKKC